MGSFERNLRSHSIYPRVNVCIRAILLTDSPSQSPAPLMTRQLVAGSMPQGGVESRGHSEPKLPAPFARHYPYYGLHLDLSLFMLPCSHDGASD